MAQPLLLLGVVPLRVARGLIVVEIDCTVQDHDEFFKVAIKHCFSLAQ